jgi:hypothetical protein
VVGDKVSDDGLSGGYSKRPDKSKAVLRIRGSGAWLTPGSGMKKKIPDPG